MAADQALKDATKYAGMLDVLSVGGDSKQATMNAQMVLNARDAARTAVTNAMAAKTKAESAKEDAMALSEDNMNRGALISSLDTAIKEADTHIKATTAIRDGSALKAEVLKVTIDSKKEKSAEDTGKTVSNLIQTAFITPAQIATLETSTVPTAAPSATMGKVMKGPSDAQGSTFAQIVGDMGMSMRVGAATGGGTRAVTAKSVDGMTIGDVYAAAATLPDRSAFSTTDGSQVNGAADGSTVVYKGIPGVLFCAGDDCKVGGTDTTLAAADKLTGSWYFTDLDADNRYLAGTGTAAGTYTMELAATYVRYGHWLTRDATSGAVTINRYTVGPTANTTDADFDVDPDNDNLSDSSAIYEGDAVGMSVLRRIVGGKEVGRDTGGFMADVTLTMKFGTAATLEGKISGFEGSAVDSGWEVELSQADIASGAVAAGVTNENSPGVDEGTWTATAWGDSGMRPKGVYGAFDADFTNGEVLGVYATRKQ